jgi:O-methyltransferase
MMGNRTIRALKDRFADWYSLRQPPRLLRLLSIPIAQQIKSDPWTYESAQMIATACSFASFNCVEGDYLEFGVFVGRTFVHAWRAGRHRPGMRFHAFDSFAGLPDPEGGDRGGNFYKGDFFSSRSMFERNLARHRVDRSRVTITEGFFDKTLTTERRQEIGLTKAALVWIDCDLYASTVPALHFVTDLLQDGSIICFDDWHCFKSDPNRGEQLACQEWLAANPQITLSPYRSFHWGGQSFIVRKALR